MVPSKQFRFFSLKGARFEQRELRKSAFRLVTVSTQDHSRIDEFLPIHDVSASYKIRINAPASVVYQRLLHLDFNELWVLRLLMTIRSGKRPSRNRVPGNLPRRLQGTGFVILDDVPGEELVVGVAGKF
jgi:hypothetical protein